jgi:hypothetical protein
MDLLIPGFFGIKLLRTCQQIHDEACEILYGENTFAFPAGPHLQTTYRSETHRIPGSPLENSSTKTEQQVAAAIDKIFDRQCHHHQLVWQDSMLHFFTKTGRHNASLIRSVKLNRHFNDNSGNIPRLNSEVELTDLLPIYASVLREVCVNLTSVNLDATDITLWHRERVVEDCMKNFVEALHGLRKLTFGNYGNVHYQPSNDPQIEEENIQMWGAALRWREIVGNRADSA